MEYRLTDEAITFGRSEKGGFNSSQLRLFDICWPPVSGWKKRLRGYLVTEDTYRRFLELSKRRFSKTYIDKAVEALKFGNFSTVETPGIKTIQKDITIYTDGSCLFNPGGRGGWAFIAQWEGKQLLCAGFSPETTNNRMELTACIEGLKEVKNKVSKCKDRIKVYTDSQYVIFCIKGYRRWLLKGKKDIKNPDLVEALVTLSESLSAEWQWVKGHMGNKFNEKCDKLAANAAKFQKAFRDFSRSGLPQNA